MEDVEDARYPPRMRTAGYGRDDGSSLAASFAWFNMRNHRSRTAKQLREESEAESEAERVRWED